MIVVDIINKHMTFEHMGIILPETNKHFARFEFELSLSLSLDRFAPLNGPSNLVSKKTKQTMRRRSIEKAFIQRWRWTRIRRRGWGNTVRFVVQREFATDADRLPKVRASSDAASLSLLARNARNSPSLSQLAWKAEDEFKPPVRRKIPPQVTRLIRLAYDNEFVGRSLKVLGISALSVYALGFYEGSLLINSHVDVAKATYFLHTYAYEQLIPSCVWGTKPAHLIAVSIDADPSVLLRSFRDNNAADAAVQLQSLGIAACRSVIAGFVCLTQVLRTLAWSLQTYERYQERVKLGNEPLFGGVPGRIIRLCGRSSDMTSHTLKYSHSNIVPIYEQPKRVHDLVIKFSDNFTVPMYWQVSEGRYFADDAWRNLSNRWSDFLTTTTTGKTLLYMEADGTNEDQSLAIAKRSTDLNVEDISQGFRSFETAVRRGLRGHSVESKRASSFRPFRVLLADLKQQVRSGSGKRTLRSRVTLRREADVLVDSQAPVLDAILSWCHRARSRQKKEIERKLSDEEDDDDDDGDAEQESASRKPPSRRLLFDTTSTEYLENIQKTMSVFGFDIIDADAYDRGELIKSEADGRSVSGVGVVEDDEGNELVLQVEPPRLIYCSTTSESINAVKSLVDAGQVDASKCCVLIDEPDGIEALQSLIEDTGHRFEVICSAIIYDDLLRQIRGWARVGHSAAEIQRELDVKFEHIDAAIFYADSD